MAADHVHVAHRQPAEELWGTVLARPRVVEVPTDVAWAPELRDDDFAPQSLRELGASAARNSRIVAELLRGRRDGDYRRTVVFCCDIPHAIALNRLLGERGVPARVIHCQQSRPAQEDALRLFREGRVGVLANVGILTEGVDVPAIDSVFLARPTRSRLLLAQMLGRGTRTAPGKDFFWAVEFTDSLREAENQAARAGEVFVNCAPAPRRRSPYRPPLRHEEPEGSPRFEEVYFSDCGILPVAVGQTFGVEIELTAPGGVPRHDERWQKTGQWIVRRLRNTATAPIRPRPLDRQPSDPTRWQVMRDASTGWEVISPALADAEGFEELRAVCAGLSALVKEHPDRLRINYRCGLHVTLATRLNTDERLRGFLKRVQRLKPGLFTLTGPSRLYPYSGRSRSYARRAGNPYCEPLRRLGGVGRLQLDEFLDDEDNRYFAVNLTRAHDDVQLLEVRLHGGTCEFRRIGPWISFPQAPAPAQAPREGTTPARQAGPEVRRPLQALAQAVCPAGLALGTGARPARRLAPLTRVVGVPTRTAGQPRAVLLPPPEKPGARDGK